MTEQRVGIEAELYATYPAPKPPPVRRPHRRPSWVIRTLRGAQGLCLGLIVAILYDQTFGLATPIPHMAFYTLVGAWIWPDRNTLALRAIVARAAACLLLALPFAWWPR